MMIYLHFCYICSDFMIFILPKLNNRLCDWETLFSVCMCKCVYFIFVWKLMSIQFQHFWYADFFTAVEDLSILSITSKTFRNLVEGFLAINPVLNKETISRLHVQSKYLPLPSSKQSDFINIFSRLGKLIFKSYNNLFRKVSFAELRILVLTCHDKIMMCFSNTCMQLQLLCFQVCLQRWIANKFDNILYRFTK